MSSNCSLESASVASARGAFEDSPKGTDAAAGPSPKPCTSPSTARGSSGSSGSTEGARYPMSVLGCEEGVDVPATFATGRSDAASTASTGAGAVRRVGSAAARAPVAARSSADSASGVACVGAGVAVAGARAPGFGVTFGVRVEAAGARAVDAASGPLMVGEATRPGDVPRAPGVVGDWGASAVGGVVERN